MRLPWAALRRLVVVGGFVVAGILGSLWGAVRAQGQDIGPPGRPTEGTKRDRAHDGDGTNRVFWTPPGGAWPSVTYEYQERAGASGEWVSLQVGTKAVSRTVTGRQHAVQCFCRVRARSAGGPWGPWSEISSGIVVDMTRPAPVTVSDEGESASGGPRLHASWSGRWHAGAARGLRGARRLLFARRP